MMYNLNMLTCGDLFLYGLGEVVPTTYLSHIFSPRVDIDKLKVSLNCAHISSFSSSMKFCSSLMELKGQKEKRENGKEENEDSDGKDVYVAKYTV